MSRYFYESALVRKANTAKKLLDLSYLIQTQVKIIYQERGMTFPVICSSTLLFLSRNGPASVTEVAKALEHPHQTVAQHLNTLGKLSIAEKRTDSNDRRRSEYYLTSVGEDQAKRLIKYNVDAADVFKSLDDDIGTDLSQLLDDCRDNLLDRSMSRRFSELAIRKDAS